MIVLVGRDPEDFNPRNSRLLGDCLREAGLGENDVERLTLSETSGYKVFRLSEGGVGALRNRLHRLKPSVIVAMGNEVAHALTFEWPDKLSGGKLIHSGNIYGARDIENRRGYAFDSAFDCPVIVTVRPTRAAAEWVPWRMLLSFDLQRAKELHDEHLCRPVREVEIVTSTRSARNAVLELGRYSRLACDIETWRDTSLACIGFAGTSGRAIVFPAQFSSYACELLRSPSITTVWANGTYDLFVLKWREGWEIRGGIEDVQIAWHAAYPELAGKKEDKKKAKMTRKSLAFLASLSTWDHYWKGDYETDEEFFIYNGKDCCITLDVDRWVQGVVDSLGARATYEHEMGLVWPVVDMLERGLRVDEPLRRSREEELSEAFDAFDAKLNALVAPLLAETSEDLRLFEEIDPTCECCGHGTTKQMACWACAGFSSKPKKPELIARYEEFYAALGPTPKTVAELSKIVLPICNVCCGAPRETRVSFNPASNAQKKVLLYDILKMPKKMKRNTKGKSVLSTDEKALRTLVGNL